MTVPDRYVHARQPMSVIQLYDYKAKVVRWKDGDTLVAAISLGFDIYTEQSLRLARIDTPETHGAAACDEGIEAWKFVQHLLPSGTAIFVRTLKTRSGRERETLGRLVAEIFFGDLTNLSDYLVEQGHAKLRSYT